MSLFNLSAKITLDSKGYERGITEATTKGQKLAGFLKSGLGTAAKVGGAALAAGATAAASGIVALTGSAVKNYAQYEQLVGGVETLFGAGGKSLEEYAESVGKTVDEAQSEYDTLMKSQNMMMDNASKAYKTAGMSANEYMENVTGFSAAMLQSLGGDTVAAAEYADMAMKDMSDNANKMGTDIESIVMTYQSLSRGNFAMLDNLKLGYGGTKEELERLIADAAALDSTVKAGDMSFANIAQAIHVVQDEMGITGTTAKEAATTIEGSVSTMKASWTNLTTGLADENADIDQLMDEFIDSVGAVADNILPVVERIVSNISGKIVENFPKIVQKGIELLAKLAAGIIQAIPDLIKSIPEVIDAIVDGFKEADVDWLEIGEDVVKGIWEGIKSLGGWLKDKVKGFIKGVKDKFTEKEGFDIHSPSKFTEQIGKYLLQGLAVGMENSKGEVMQDVDGIISELKDRFSTVQDIFDTKGDISDLEYQLWESENADASTEEKYGAKIASLNGQIENQEAVVDAATTAFEEAEKQYGKNSEESLKFKKAMLEERLELSKLVEERKKYNDEMQEYFAFTGTGIVKPAAVETKNIPFNKSTSAAESAAKINSVFSAMRESQNQPTSFNLVLPDGSKLASYMFDSLANYGAANGTPILNPT